FHPMQIRNFIKPIVPHFLAVALFILVSFIYFYPVIEGKVLKANDSMVATINSKEITDFRAEYGKEPLWTNSLFSGMPAYLISTRYPGNLFKKADTVLRSMGMPVSVLFLSMAGFYIMLLLFGVNPWLAIAGSVGYGLSSFLFQVIAAGHNTQAIALAYMAPMIGSVWYAYRRDAVKGALLTAFFLTLEIMAIHPQMAYYSLMCLLVFGVTEFVFAVKEKTILKFVKTSAILVIPFIIAIGINFAFLYTTYEYGKYSTRSKSELTTPTANKSTGLDRDYITFWSYGVGESMNLLIPDFKGGSSEPFDRNSETVKVLKQNGNAAYINQVMKYWGTQPGTAGPHYVGAIVFFLFVLGLIIVKGPEKWWLLAATLLSVMLAWGKNFMPLTNLFIDYFPGYDKFRSVTFILVISQFCIPLLGVLALRDLFKSETPKKDFLKALTTATAITGGVLISIMLIPGFAGSFLNPYENQSPDWLKSALVADRKHLLENDTFRSLVFILLSAGVILSFMYEKLRKEYAIAIIGILILADLWTVDRRYLNSDNFQKQTVFNKSFTPTAADSYILKDPSYFRVWNHIVSTFNDNSPTSYFHKSIGGYNGAKMKRYQELIDSAITKDFNVFDAVGQNAKTLDEILPVFDKTYTLNMLNTKYIIFNPDAPPIVNPKALGNAWFVEIPEIAGNADQEISMTSRTDPSKAAIIDKRFRDQVTKSAYPIEEGDNIRLMTYQPNELVYKSSARSEKLALFSDIYYPAGWKCYVDGKESKYFRANYVLRAMIVPGGDHEIRFTFKPSSYYTGNT
ncbi:MAG TPA: YfhO family protein, partial [Bacteroidales bacterium]|nr:YfhO family protein [Bacteroidales bacterium]